MKVKFNPLALAEMIDSARFFESRRKGYGRYFLERVRSCIESIRRHPQVGTIVRKKEKIRSHLVQVFRYSVLYSVQADGIYVIAVKHHSRNPEYWLDRMNDPP